MTAPRALARRMRASRSLEHGVDATGGPRRPIRRAIALAFLGAMLAIHAVPAAAAVVDDPLGFEEGRCAVAVPESRLDDVRCGFLIVPERRAGGSDPDRRLRLPVVVIRSESAERVTDPLVVPVAATPGGSSLDALSYFLSGPDWVGPRDVVLMEQRGGLHAEPSLDCPEVDGALALAARLDRLQACRDRLVEEGVDLGAYTSAESAADLADLYTALRYGTWNLYGVSDGSRLAMTVMRDNPAGLRSVILDGAFPPDIDRYELFPAGLQSAVDALVARCRADRECRMRYPDLAGSLDDALERADREPFMVVLTDPATGATVTETLDADGVAAQIAAALQDSDSARILPFVIDRLAQGDASAALPLAQWLLDLGARAAEGLDLSVECADELPFHDPAAVAAAQDASLLTRHLTIYEARTAECAVWDVPSADPRESLPVASSVPTLLLSGEDDPSAPPAWSEIAGVGLARHFSYDFPATGHAPAWNGGCAASIARQFLTDPVSEPKSGCIERMPTTSFLTTADIDPTSAVYRVDHDLRTSPSPGQIGIAIATVLLFVGTLAYGIVYAVRRRWDAPSGAVFAAVSAASLNLAFVGILALVLSLADPLVLQYGLPAAAWPLLLLPFAALACGVMLVVLLVRAWMRDDGGLAHRVILTVSAIGTLGFAAWLLARGLLAL